MCISVIFSLYEKNSGMVVRVINLVFPDPGRFPNPKTRVWAMQPGFSGLAFDIFKAEMD